MSGTYIEESKRGWYSTSDKPTTEQLQLGCLQRIAAATESMAKHNDQLVRERDGARADRDYWQDEAERMTRRLNAMKGQVTKLRRKLETEEGKRWT